MRSNVYWIAVAAALGGLLFGFDIAVINGAIVFLRKQFQLSDLQTEVAVSSLLLGCVFGASLAGTLSDRFGRKRILLWSAVLFLVSSLGAAMPRNLAEFTAARLLRRHRHWHGIHAFAVVRGGNFSRSHPRAPGGAQPARDRGWNSVRLSH
jgi:MFS family permease